MLQDEDYASTMHKFLALIEEEGHSTTQAARKVQRSRMWIWRIVAKSREGEALAWIAQEYDRVRLKNMRCDICSSPLAVGSWVKYREGTMGFDFCGPVCKAAWIEAGEE